MTYEEWREKYQPIQNELVKGAGYDDSMFDTEEFIQQYKSTEYHPHQIWTVVNGSGKELHLIPGRWQIDAMGYFITEQHWGTNDFNNLKILI